MRPSGSVSLASIAAAGAAASVPLPPPLAFGPRVSVPAPPGSPSGVVAASMPQRLSAPRKLAASAASSARRASAPRRQEPPAARRPAQQPPSGLASGLGRHSPSASVSEAWQPAGRSGSAAAAGASASRRCTGRVEARAQGSRGQGPRAAAQGGGVGKAGRAAAQPRPGKWRDCPRPLGRAARVGGAPGREVPARTRLPVWPGAPGRTPAPTPACSYCRQLGRRIGGRAAQGGAGARAVAPRLLAGAHAGACKWARWARGARKEAPIAVAGRGQAPRERERAAT